MRLHYASGHNSLGVLVTWALVAGLVPAARGQFARGVGGVGTIYELGTVRQPGQLRNIGGFMRVSSNPVLERTRSRPPEPQAPIAIGIPSAFGTQQPQRGMSAVASVSTYSGLGANARYATVDGPWQRARTRLGLRGVETSTARYAQRPEVALPPVGRTAGVAPHQLPFSGAVMRAGALMASRRGGPMALPASGRTPAAAGVPGEGNQAVSGGTAEPVSAAQLKRDQLEARARKRLDQARALFAGRRYAEALAQYKLSEEAGIDVDESRLGRLAALIATGQYNVAASLLATIVSEATGVPEGLHELAQFYAEPQDRADHYRLLEDYCAGSHVARVQVLLGVVRWGTGDQAGAVRALEAAVERSPSDPVAVRLLEHIRTTDTGSPS